MKLRGDVVTNALDIKGITGHTNKDKYIQICVID